MCGHTSTAALSIDPCVQQYVTVVDGTKRSSYITGAQRDIKHWSEQTCFTASSLYKNPKPGLIEVDTSTVPAF